MLIREGSLKEAGRLFESLRYRIHVEHKQNLGMFITVVKVDPANHAILLWLSL